MSVVGDWDAIVVGGGLAGLSAALRVAEGGGRVLVLERGIRLGGRAGSYLDSETGESLDTCQHVAMGCCVHYRDLLSRVGQDGFVRWSHALHWTERGGRRSTIGLNGLSAPLHLAGGASLAFLSVGEKLAFGRAVFELCRARPESLEAVGFSDWLADHEQPARVVDLLWTPLMVGACNTGVDRVSASAAAHLLQRAFVSDARGTPVGVPVRPLGDLCDALRARIESRGGEVRLRARVDRVGEGWVEVGGERLGAAHVVLAVAFDRLGASAGLVDDAVRAKDPRFDRAAGLEHSPIVGVFAELEGGALPVEHSVLVGCETDWVFRKDDGGTQVHAVKSAAGAWVGLDASEIERRVLDDLRACFPEACGGVRFSRARVVKEKRATFMATPGSWALRPEVEGSSKVLIAGDFVRTGWPATMEGAVRSGNLAAEVVLGSEPGAFAPPELGRSVLAGVLGFGTGRATVGMDL